MLLTFIWLFTSFAALMVTTVCPLSGMLRGDQRKAFDNIHDPYCLPLLNTKIWTEIYRAIGIAEGHECWLAWCKISLVLDKGTFWRFVSSVLYVSLLLQGVSLFGWFWLQGIHYWSWQDTLIDHAKEQASSLSNIIAQATKWRPPMPRILLIM